MTMWKVLQTRDDYELVRLHDPLVLKLWDLAVEGKSWEEAQAVHLTSEEKDVMSNRKTGVYDIIKHLESVKEEIGDNNRKRAAFVGNPEQGAASLARQNKHPRLPREGMQLDPVLSAPPLVIAAKKAPAENVIDLFNDDDSDDNDDIIMEVRPLAVSSAQPPPARKVSLGESVIEINDDSDDDDVVEAMASQARNGCLSYRKRSKMMDAAMAMGVASPGLLSEPVASARLDPNKLCGPNHKREKICRGFFKTRWSNFILLLKTEMRSRLLPSDAAAIV